MITFRRRQSKKYSLLREELRAQSVRPALFELLEPRLLLDGGPTALDDLFELPGDTTSVIVSPLDNDDIPAPEGTTIESFTDGVYGTVAQDGDTLLYTLNDGVEFPGRDTFEYTITDGENTSTAIITVGSAPTVEDDVETVVEDSADNEFDVLANDVDYSGGETLTLTGVSGAENGVATIGTNGDGDPVVLYTPDADFYGTEELTYTVEDADGLTGTGAVTVVVTDVNDAPVVLRNFVPINVNRNPAPAVFNLGRYFGDVDEQLIYRFTSNIGTFDVLLYQFRTPITVANFRQYTDSGAYANSFIHRAAELQTGEEFVVQGGGFTFDDADGYPREIPENDPIVNEFGVSNTRGTIAMAKLEGDPDSATSQWFFNVGDNSENLDNQNGGFTVFGEVLGNGMDVIDAVAALPVYDFGSPYDTLPLQDYDGQSPVTSENLVMFQSIQALASPLTFTVEGNTRPELVTADIDADGQLILQYAGNLCGTAQITIRATDNLGVFVETTLDIVVNDNPDLVVNLGRVTLPDLPVFGDRGNVQLFVTNREPYRARGRIDLQVWASKDGVIDGVDDILLGTRANQFVNLGKNQTRASAVNVHIHRDVPSGEYSLVGVVDSGKAIAERYEDNNTAVSPKQYGFYPSFVDLQGTVTRVWYRNNAMTTGDRGFVLVKVSNNGNATANGRMDLSLYLSATGTAADGDTLVGTLRNARVVLSRGKFKVYRVRFAIPSRVDQGVYTLYADIDSDNRIPETAKPASALPYDPEENNIAYAPHALLVQLPDLRARIYSSNLSAAPRPGQRGYAWVVISNDSYVRARGRVKMSLYLKNKETGEKTLLTTRNNVGVNLRAGRYRSLYVRFRLPQNTNGQVNLPMGEYQLLAEVTSASAGLQENDDNLGNNEDTYGAYQIRKSFVDLSPTIDRVLLRNNPASAGELLRVRVKYTNKGNSTLVGRGVVIRLWACTSSNLEAAGAVTCLLATKTTGFVLRPDQYTRRYFRVRLPDLDELPRNDYYLIAEVDADLNNDPDVDGVVLEDAGDDYDAEANNTHALYRGLRVGLPDLTGAIRRVTLPRNMIAGQKGRVVIRVTNNGTVRAKGRYTLSLYAQKDGQDDVRIGQTTRRLHLRPGRSVNVTAAVNTDTVPTEGDYTIVAVIDSGETIPELNNANNTAAATGKYTIREAYVNLTGVLRKPTVSNPAVSGAQIQIPLTIRNEGNNRIHRRVEIEFFAVVAGEKISLGTMNPLVNLAAGKAKNLTFTATLPNVTDTQTYHVEAVIDPEGLLENLGDDETDNDLASNVNLVLNPASSTLNGTLLAVRVPNPATVNDDVTATVRVRNTGNVRYNGQVKVEFRTETGVVLGTRVVHVNLPPNRFVDIARTMPVPEGLAVGTTYDVLAVLNDEPGGANINNDAGVAAVTIGAPNLTAGVLGEGLTGTVVKTTTRSVDVRVANDGNVRAEGAADVELWATRDGDLTDGVGDFLLGMLENRPYSLQPNESSTETLTFPLPEAMDNNETYRLATVITPTEGLANEVAADNTTVDPDTFNVESAAVDLTVNAQWHHGIYAADGDPDTAENIFLRGQAYPMTISVTNAGNLPAADFDTELQALRCYNETDGWTHYADPLALGTLHIADLAPGETFTDTLWFTFPATLPATQTYDVVVVTDADGVVAETNEGNNLSDPDGLTGGKTYYFAV